MTISAKIIAHSINPNKEEICTYELEYPRFIHSEFMTHRVFSRNAASSRAIPVWKMIKQVWFNMAFPIYWGKKQAGMQATKEISTPLKWLCISIWWISGMVASFFALILMGLGLHKQVANRILEPWIHIKVVMTTTKIDNWEHLRLHKDAQPEIYLLAYLMRKARKDSTPVQLKWGDWHLPYAPKVSSFTLKEKLQISSSCCAQVSYRLLNSSLGACIRIYDKMVHADVLHASPFEHPTQANIEGSGNFTGTGWKQLRSFLEEDTHFLS